MKKLLLAATAVLALCALSVQAREDGADVRTLCPTIEDHLEDRLGALLVRHGVPGRSEVNFEVEGQTVRAVQTQGGPVAYRQATQRAIQDLACDGGDAGTRAVRLEVVFRKPEPR